MGSFANSAFQTMLGWLQGLAGRIWNGSASGPEADSLLSWVGQNWKWLALTLCAAGLVVDLAVYLIRWQPYRVWRSFFRRLFRRENRADEPDTPPAEPLSRRAEPVQSSVYAAPAAPEVRMPARDAFSRSSRTRYFDKEASAPSYREEETLPYEQDPKEEDSRTRRFEQSILPRKRRVRVRDFFSDEQKPAATTPPQELIDRREAYHRPVYPNNWKGRTDTQHEDGGI